MYVPFSLPPPPLSLSHTHTLSLTHTHAHARTHTHTQRNKCARLFFVQRTYLPSFTSHKVALGSIYVCMSVLFFCSFCDSLSNLLPICCCCYCCCRYSQSFGYTPRSWSGGNNTLSKAVTREGGGEGGRKVV